MANQSEKRLAKNKEKNIKIFLYIMIAVNIINIGSKALKGTDIGKWDIFEFLFFSAVNYFTYSQISRCMEYGISYEGYLDIFAVNLFVQLTTSFSGVFWYAYLVVPGYFVFLLLKKCFGYFGKVNYVPTEEETAGGKDKKKKEKKEKVKYVKVK
eukprot:CAMPEP_0176436588 /NCGR_PEP_ID=MMETSP0127-20121128/18064_1 /TAXON_ID=938130 /ORGANISM="Platyophrya macrostoma, Strain WH" /LENGTH=153 /DNA_ID=CAMNT_0017819949 /DNA_START=59 /DNA_END=520 /DNA_ORIENTATION=+